MNDLEELGALAPTPRELTIAGATLEVLPLRVGQIPPFLRAAGPLIAEIGLAQPDWIYLFSEHGERLIEAIGIAVGRPAAWVAALEGDEAIRLAAAVLEVNADFFIRRMAPAMVGLAQALERALPAAAGPAPSSASSATATAATTS